MRYADHKKTLDEYGDHIHLGTFLYSSYTKDSKKLKLSSSWNNPLKKSYVNPKILNIRNKI